MSQLKEFLQKWNLSNAVPLAETETSTLFEVSSSFGPAVLKVLNEMGKKHEAVGAEFLKACDGKGAAKLYAYDEGAHLIERLYGENLYQFSKVAKEEEASRHFVSIIKKIHKVSPEGVNIKPLEHLFDAFKRVTIPEALKETIEQGSYVAQELLNSQAESVLLHGDLHHENILQRDSGEFVCFDSQACVGDPAYELGTTLKNPWDYQEISHDQEQFKARAKFFSRELNLPYERVVGFAFVHVCLSMCWALEDGENYDHSFGVSQIVRPILKGI